MSLSQGLEATTTSGEAYASTTNVNSKQVDALIGCVAVDKPYIVDRSILYPPKEPAVVEPIIDECVAANVRKLLDGLPRIYEFGLDQSSAERFAAIQSLPSAALDAIAAMHDELVDDCCEAEITGHAAVHMLSTHDGDDTGECISEDWRLRVFGGLDDDSEYGALYDFNGWPGDNESGLGVYYSANPGSKPITVFTNGDENLVPAHGYLAKTVESYAERRESENRRMAKVRTDVRPGLHD
jgi:hypothetical protein